MLNKGCNMSLGIEWCLQSELSALCDVFVMLQKKKTEGGTCIERLGVSNGDKTQHKQMF